MQPLDKRLRNQLENIVVEARELAERAARAALEELGVEEASPFSDQSEAQRDLRRRLRLHGRQLGDPLNGGKAQGMDRLVEEVAYEHWHRMLFARFLAENALLMYPDPDGPVPVTLQDCEDLAADEGAANGWELAARYAAQMLPRIFRVDSPVFELKLPTNFQRPLERLLADLPKEVFTASDALGWVYQFWQTNNKERINKSEVKIGARELPAVTQLFTEPYMVSFLLDNALGAWWAARRLSAEDLRDTESEEELRRKAAIPGAPLQYLRFVREEPEGANEQSADVQAESSAEQGAWTPAAGTFAQWPDNLAELKVMDPCCGSGHFLVAVLLMLAPMRQTLEGLSPQQAVDAVLRDNLHGLELDQRCVELGAFALALTAWRYPGAGGYRKLPEIQVACSGLSVSVAKEEWKQLDLGRKNLSIALDWMHDAFRDAPVLGSLLNPAKTDAAKIVSWEELSNALSCVLDQEITDEQIETTVAALGITHAAKMLMKDYSLVCTNFPFLGIEKQNDFLRGHLTEKYPQGYRDLAVAMLLRWLDVPGGVSTVAAVMPGEWTFLRPHRHFRRYLVQSHSVRLLASLGYDSFDTPIRAQPVLMIADSTPPENIWITRLTDLFQLGFEEKKERLADSKVVSLKQSDFIQQPDARITAHATESKETLADYCDARTGMSAGDSSWFERCFWETVNVEGWDYMQSSISAFRHFAGREGVVWWEDGKGRMKKLAESVKNTNHAAQNWRRGMPNWGKCGVALSLMGDLPATMYTGDKYNINCCAIVPKSPEYLPALSAYAMSGALGAAIRDFDRSLKVGSPKTVLSAPFDYHYWASRADSEYLFGLPQPYTDDPTQWIFHGHTCGSVVWDDASKVTAHGPLRTDDTVLQVAVARLLGYRWPAELDLEMELAAEQREWVERCEALLSHVDNDGIVCIPPVRGEAAAADRLLSLLAAAYGEQWSNEVLAKLLSNSGHAGKTLENWLRDKFFAQHCKLFQNRPFIWHVWDGLRDGFSALVNYHKLDHKNLESLIYTYLGDWISRQKRDLENGVDGAREKLGAAETLKQRLELILEGEAPYDIFVRWKPLAEQPIGWNPDLNDGVRLNIRPFMTVSDIKKKGGGVLRDKPNIHWKKDRGKDVESAPWFDTFGGERINDHHLTLVEKRAARGV